MTEREIHEPRGNGPDPRDPTPDKAARASEMLRLRDIEHLTLREIGERYGVTRERARQIINRHRNSLQSQSPPGHWRRSNRTGPRSLRR